MTGHLSEVTQMHNWYVSVVVHCLLHFCGYVCLRVCYCFRVELVKMENVVSYASLVSVLLKLITSIKVETKLQL